MKVIGKMSAVAVMAVVTLLSSVMVSQARGFSGQVTPGVDRRERRQSRRIRQGVRSGEITRREANRLARQQARIRRHERRAKSNGYVSARERRSLQRQDNRANRNIYRKKHNRRYR
jgi:hypothetical protein